MKKQFTPEEKTYLVKMVHDQFINYYRITHDDMNYSEKLFLNDLKEHVVNGFDYALNKED